MAGVGRETAEQRLRSRAARERRERRARRLPRRMHGRSGPERGSVGNGLASSASLVPAARAFSLPESAPAAVASASNARNAFMGSGALAPLRTGV